MTSLSNSNDSLTWHYIAASTEALFFADNGIAIAEWKGKKICIAQQDNAFYAFAYKCPHTGVPLFLLPKLLMVLQLYARCTGISFH